MADNNLNPPKSVIDPLNSQVDNTSNLGSKLPLEAEEAAQNIKQAEQLGMTPDNYAEMKKPLLESIPKESPVRVDEIASISRQHASVIEKDKSWLDMISDQVKYTAESIQRKKTQRELNELVRNEMFPPNDFNRNANTFRMDEVRGKLQSMDLEKKYGYDFTESLPGTVVSEIHNMYYGVKENPIPAAAGAVVGGLKGALTLNPLGIAIGAVAGLGTGSVVSMAWDGMKETTAMVYDDLRMNATDFSPEAVSNRKFLSAGAGAVTGLIEAGPWSRILKRTPWVNQLFTRKFAELAANKSISGTLTRLGKAFADEGLTEVGQDFIQDIFTETGKSWNGTESSFLEGIDKALTNWEAKKAAQTLVIGGLTGATVQGGAEVVGRVGGAVQQAVTRDPVVEAEAPSIPQAPTEVESDIIKLDLDDNVVKQAGSAVRLKYSVDTLADLMNKSKTNELLPEELNTIIDNQFRDAGVETVFVDKDQLNEWADTPEKAELIQPIIDDRVLTEANINAPLEIPIFQAVRLATKDQNISSLYKASPESPSALEWVRDQERIRSEGGDLTLHQDIFNERPYMEAVTFENPENNSSLTNTKRDLVKSLKTDADKGIHQVNDFYQINENAKAQQEMMEAVVDNPDVQKIESYLDGTYNSGDLNSFQKERVKKGKTAYPINPASLPADLRIKFEKNSVLRKRNVFDKKGMDAESVATLMGEPSVESLLLKLRDTPTRKEATEQYTGFLESQKDYESRTDRALRDSSFVKAYDNVTVAHLGEVKTIKDRAKIRESAPSFNVIKSEAKVTIDNTPIKSLNPTKYKVGERKSQRKASQAVKDGNYTLAFNEKINAAKNSQLAKESHIAISKTNRMLNYIATVKVGQNKVVYDNARPEIRDSIDHLLDVFGFDLDNRGNTNPDSLKKLQELMEKSNEEGNVTIPEEVYNWTIDQPRPQDLSVDQLAYVEAKLRNIMHFAAMRNELYGDPLQNLTPENVDIIAEGIFEEVSQQTNYDESKALVKPDPYSEPEKFRDSLMDITFRFHKNQKHYLTQAGNGKPIASINTIYHRLNNAFRSKEHQLKDVTSYVNAARAKYGKDVDVKTNEIVNVPELADNPNFKNGKLRRQELMGIFAHLGNEVNTQRLENYGVPRKTLRNIVEKYLDVRDLEFVRDTVWAYHRDNSNRYLQFIKRVRGVEIELTTPTPVVINGVEYEGGHVPLVYTSHDIKSQSLQEDIKHILDSTDPTKRVFFDQGDAFEGIVRSQHDKERSTNTLMPDITFDGWSRGFESLAHDMNLRVPVRDAMLLLTHEQTTKALMGTIGPEGYNILVNDLAMMSKSDSQRDMFRTQKQSVELATSWLNKSSAVAFVAYNLSSLQMNVLTLVGSYANLMSAGLNTKWHLMSSIGKMMNPFTMKKAFDLAREIDPTLDTHSEVMEAIGTVTGPTGLPKRRYFTGGVSSWVSRSGDRFAQVGAIIFQGLIETMFKVTAANAAYSQFISGDSRDMSYSKLKAMSKSERHQAALRYAGDISVRSTYSNRTLDKAVIQKMPDTWTRMLSMFFNDARNYINGIEQSGRNIKSRVKESQKLAREGEYVKAHHALNDAGANVMSVLVFTVLAGAIMKAIRDNHPFATDRERDEDGRSEKLSAMKFEDVLADIPSWMMSFANPTDRNFLPTQIAEAWAGSHPVMRTLMYGLEVNKAPSAPAIDLTWSSLKALKDTPTYWSLFEQDLTGMLMMRELTDEQFRNLMSAGALATTFLPANAITKFRKFIQEGRSLGLPAPNLSFVKEKVTEAMDAVIEQNTPNSEDLFEQDMKDDSKPDDLEKYIEEIKEIRKSINPPDYSQVVNEVPNEWFEQIKYAESDGKWNAQAKGSSAFGMYQFTEGTWKTLVASPEGIAAGLTMKDRYTRSGQEKGMRIFTAQNVVKLMSQGVDINLRNVYFAHHFGATNAAKVLNAPDNKRLPSQFLTKGVKKANPALVKRNVRTTGDLKDYLDWVLKQGAKKLANASI